ncbi:hypothetical protein CWATWH0402_2236 [Crocosphaera watsonii WH 0402]|uniref:Uncharacterized protein n=1 Tax=Crocosphaera watsonii WH 0402 TaxID=1284629 RepID=T2JQZ7_CROWT|nr:hypothetical protein CWATWH0402_2236 [Crocosphaera watsonii WH 0402]
MAMGGINNFPVEEKTNQNTLGESIVPTCDEYDAFPNDV